MNIKRIRIAAGAMLILGAVLVNIPYTMLIVNFDYPDILRQPAGEILTQFAAGGDGLVWTWFSFAWVGLPILIGILLLPQALSEAGIPIPWPQRLAYFFGTTGGAVQIIGLLRWTFVVPILSRLYTSPQASAATREAIEIAFRVVNQFGGVILGEHVGQVFTILWMFLLSYSLFGWRDFPRWLPWAGIAASVVYALAQGELLATAMPMFPYWGEAGFIGSLLWLGWIIALGIYLILSSRSLTYEHSGENSRYGAAAL